jgi:hypothetical protein
MGPELATTEPGKCMGPIGPRPTAQPTAWRPNPPRGATPGSCMAVLSTWAWRAGRLKVLRAAPSYPLSPHPGGPTAAAA